MPTGITVEIRDDVAELAFENRALRSATLTRLHELGGPDSVRVDTGGTRRTYKIGVDLARRAGLIDDPEPAPAERPEPPKGNASGKDWAAWLDAQDPPIAYPEGAGRDELRALWTAREAEIAAAAEGTPAGDNGGAGISADDGGGVGTAGTE